jgi:hypothetical protein
VRFVSGLCSRSLEEWIQLDVFLQTVDVCAYVLFVYEGRARAGVVRGEGWGMGVGVIDRTYSKFHQTCIPIHSASEQTSLYHKTKQ